MTDSKPEQKLDKLRCSGTFCVAKTHKIQIEFSLFGFFCYISALAKPTVSL